MSSKPHTLKRSAFLPREGSAVDMTEGNILRHILSFSFPLLIGNIFQQMYNMVDTWVVGNYVSNEAFSAVGSVGPIINMLISVFTGLASGAGVVISQNYGAKHYDEVHKAVHTSIVMTLFMGVCISILGILLAPAMLHMMKTPEDVFPEAKAYLTTYFASAVGLTLYNMGAGILRAVGDSTRPFYYLVICALINTALDLLFVLVFKMGVVGVALATALAQLTSAVLVLITLLRSRECIQVIPGKLRIHMNSLKRIIAVGIPASIQMAITQFSNIFVQSYINFFGSDCMSGWTAYSKVDQLLFLPMQSIALASTTFVGQNLGKNQVQRARKGVTVSILMAVAFTALLLIPVMTFPRQIVSFFNDKPEVVDYGAMLLLWLSPFYVLCCFNQIYAGALRGAGNTKAPMVIMLVSFVAFRQVYLFIMSRVWNEIIPIGMGYPAGWLLCSLLSTIYYYKVSLSKTRVVVGDAKE